jgi:2-octaprenyl-6-methoxyphenol hydroxylase
MNARDPILVVGGGPTGLATALSLEATGHAVTLVAGRAEPRDDGRAAAILADGLAMLDAAGAGEAIRAEGAPLAAIRIIDVTDRLFRAPTVLFRASELGERAFGASLPTRRIVGILAEQAARRPAIRIVAANVTEASAGEHGTAVVTDTGERIEAGLAVAADGRRSLLREAAGIRARQWSYPQAALTFMVRHRRDHDDISTEFHTSEGPFTLVPAGDRLSSVVWMMAPDKAARLHAAGPEALAQAAEGTARGILGPFSVISDIGHYPMGGLSVDRMAAGSVVLVGETAHAFPPIGAQGLNLGLRDVRDLVAALASGGDRRRALAGWDAERRRDAALTTAGVDALNRSLLSSLPPVGAARGAAMAALGALPPLRRLAMTLGMGRTPALPFRSAR